MEKKSKDAHEPTPSTSRMFLYHLNKQELKSIKVAVKRKDIPESPHAGPLLRNLENPEELVIHRMVTEEAEENGTEDLRRSEGQRPIFDRPDVVVNQEFEERIVLTSPARSKSSRRSRSPGARRRSEDRRKSSSPARYRSRSPSPSRKYSRRRTRSRERTKSPPYRSSNKYGRSSPGPSGSGPNADKGNNSYKYRDTPDVQYRKSVERSKQPGQRRSRSSSPRYAGRRSPRVEVTYQKDEYGPRKDDRVHGKEGKSREFVSGTGSTSRKSYSQERRSSRSPEKADQSKYYKYKSSPHRTSRSPSHADKRHNRHSPPQHRHETSYKGPSASERGRKRSRSPNRPPDYRSRHRSPHKSEGYRDPSRYDRRSRSPHPHDARHREHRRSPSPHDRDAYRRSHRDYRKRYSRSPSDERRYRRPSDRQRSTSPARYRDRRPNVEEYLEMQPPMGPINYGPPWYPWPLRPGMFPPPGLIVRNPGPFRPPIPPMVMPQRPRLPRQIIYNNRTTRFVDIKKPAGTSTSELTVSTSSENSKSVGTNSMGTGAVGEEVQANTRNGEADAESDPVQSVEKVKDENGVHSTSPATTSKE